MGILTSIFAKWKQPQQVTGNDPNAQTIQTANPTQPPSAPQPTTAMRRYAEMEAEMSRSHQILESQTIVKPKKSGGFKKFGKTLIWIGVLAGIPVAIIYVANLPYPVIRQPVAKAAPLLLLPSNMAIEANFKKGQATIEESKQLIMSPTSGADLDRGELKLKEGKTALDAIPVWYVADWVEYSRGYYGWGYDWRFTPAGLQTARIEAGNLEARVFQEKNAQIALTDAERDATMAKALFQQAANPVDKKVAVQNWQSAIDRLNQIPAQTMAGRKSQQLASNSTRDLKELAGLSGGNEKVSVLIGSAEEFAKKAAETGRNPPHPSDRWIEIASMWQEGIQRLGSIPANDLQGYSEAQRRLSEYKSSLSEVRVRLKNEQESVQFFDAANQKLIDLFESKNLERGQALSRFMAINNDLEKIKDGTTVYLRSQKIKLEVQSRLRELQK